MRTISSQRFCGNSLRPQITENQFSFNLSVGMVICIQTNISTNWCYWPIQLFFLFLKLYPILEPFWPSSEHFFKKIDIIISRSSGSTKIWWKTVKIDQQCIKCTIAFWGDQNELCTKQLALPSVDPVGIWLHLQRKNHFWFFLAGWSKLLNFIWLCCVQHFWEA